MSEDGEVFGFFNYTSKYEILPKYGGGKHLGNLLFAVTKVESGRNNFGVIDLEENEILPFSFNEIPNFSEPVFLLLKKRKPLREWLLL